MNTYVATYVRAYEYASEFYKFLGNQNIFAKTNTETSMQKFHKTAKVDDEKFQKGINGKHLLKEEKTS